jgi:hypothetical protein
LGGKEETSNVLDFLENYSNPLEEWALDKYETIPKMETSPILLIASRLK